MEVCHFDWKGRKMRNKPTDIPIHISHRIKVHKDDCDALIKYALKSQELPLNRLMEMQSLIERETPPPDEESQMAHDLCNKFATATAFYVSTILAFWKEAGEKFAEFNQRKAVTQCQDSSIQQASNPKS